MADKTFSVMVNKDGVIDYPSNLITANNLAKFGSEVVGTFKEIKFGSEETGASTIILNLTEDENLGYNTDLIISNKNLSGYTNSIILNFSENIRLLGAPVFMLRFLLLSGLLNASR